MRKFLLAAAGVVALVLSSGALRAEEATIEVVLQGDVFTPAEIKVPVGQPTTLRFTNRESKPAEIEAKDLKIEKIVPAGSSIVARVKPSKPGRFLVVNEYREDVAKAYIVAE
jgi:plastocyanin